MKNGDVREYVSQFVRMHHPSVTQDQLKKIRARVRATSGLDRGIGYERTWNAVRNAQYEQCILRCAREVLDGAPSKRTPRIDAIVSASAAPVETPSMLLGPDGKPLTRS